MEIELLANRIRALFQDGVFGPASDDVLTSLRNQREPECLLDFARRLVPLRDLWAGGGLVYRISKQIELSDEFPDSRRSGFHIIGCCSDGDFIVMKPERIPFEIGFVTHEEIFPGCSWSDFYLPVCNSLYDFLFLSNVPLASSGDSVESVLPENYYEAKDANWEPKRLEDFGIDISALDFPLVLPDPAAPAPAAPAPHVESAEGAKEPAP